MVGVETTCIASGAKAFGLAEPGKRVATCKASSTNRTMHVYHNILSILRGVELDFHTEFKPKPCPVCLADEVMKLAYGRLPAQCPIACPGRNVAYFRES